MIDIKYILLILITIILGYFIFFNKNVIITERLENFRGNDLNIHRNDDYNIINFSPVNNEN
jgi:hypothetical protein